MNSISDITDNTWLMDLRDPRYAYLFGFLQADGHLKRGRANKGLLSVELGVVDKWLLERFAELVPFYSSVRTRTRTTNFKDDYESAVWQVNNLAFRRGLILLGMPEGSKSRVIAPPLTEFSQPDYYRGIVDADGSLGLTAKGFPFVSLTTNSGAIAEGYLRFVSMNIGRDKTTTRNTRDGVFNINVYKEDAQRMVAVLYYDGCLALPRKIEKAHQVLAWIRPVDMKKVEGRRNWTKEEDTFALTHTIKEAMDALNRSEKSINIRRWRLRNGLINRERMKRET